MKAHVVEILFTRHCRHLCEAIERVRAAIEVADDIEVRLVQVETMREARKLAFVGSPTVRVDGRDVEPNQRSTTFGLYDRDYVVDGHVERAPPSDWIIDAL
jgi:hypothetical protein